MIKVATVGVIDHKLNVRGPPGRSRNLINRAIPTAMHSKRTVKMDAPHRAQIGNLTLLLESVEEKLKDQREYVQVAETTEAWLLRFKARVEEVEGDSPRLTRSAANS